MQRDQAYALDILEAARRASGYVVTTRQEEFLADPMRQDAVIRCLAVVGEAARRLSPDFRAACPEAPWARMVGMRNRLVHDYDAVDAGRVWDTARHDLPALIAALEPLVPPEDPP